MTDALTERQLEAVELILAAAAQSPAMADEATREALDFARRFWRPPRLSRPLSNGSRSRSPVRAATRPPTAARWLAPRAS